jgi:isopenicillin-N N-acyltransferase-like protein
MRFMIDRRRLLQATAATILAGRVAAEEKTLPRVPDHILTVISGKPRERGKQYGAKYKDAIADFLDKEIFKPFAKTQEKRKELLQYAGLCSSEVKKYSATLADELEGIAEGSGRTVEELVLLNLHEEVHYQLPLPIEHCTAVAVGPPDTADGNSYVGQTWDWMESVYGKSSVLLWKRPEGSSVLAYAYPGLWVGAGLNSAGVALCWTSAGPNAPAPQVGIPSYLLIAQMLYADSLKEAIDEAKRAKLAGWFTFVMADGKGNLVNLEGSPKEVVVEGSQGHLSRVGYGSRQMTRTGKDQPVKRHAQCQRMYELLDGGKGKLDRGMLQGFFGDHKSTICKHGATLDAMLFNCTTKEAYVSRGPGCSGRWKRFTFEDKG